MFITEAADSAPSLRSLADATHMFVGAAANYGYLTGTEKQCKWSNCTEDILNYTSILGREFNLITAENALKFKGIESKARGVYNFTNGDALSSFAHNHSMALRGHNLIWVAHNPTWLVTSAQSMDAITLEGMHHSMQPSMNEPYNLRQYAFSGVMAEHIAATGAHYAGEVYSWDVVNEAVVDVPKVRTCSSWDCALKGKVPPIRIL